jgi:hypothetical protein
MKDTIPSRLIETKTLVFTVAESKAIENMLRALIFQLTVKIHKNGLDNDPLVEELNSTMDLLLKVNPNA